MRSWFHVLLGKEIGLELGGCEFHLQWHQCFLQSWCCQVDGSLPKRLRWAHAGRGPALFHHRHCLLRKDLIRFGFISPSQGGYDRAWTTQFPGQTRNGWNSSWARINADGSVDAAYSGWLGFTSRIYNPSLGDGAKPIVKASCVSQSSGRGADRITSNHYMALIPEGNAGTGEVTGWTLRVGYDAWAVTNCSGRWRVYDYRANGSVGGPYDI